MASTRFRPTRVPLESEFSMPSRSRHCHQPEPPRAGGVSELRARLVRLRRASSLRLPILYKSRSTALTLAWFEAGRSTSGFPKEARRGSQRGERREVKCGEMESEGERKGVVELQQPPAKRMKLAVPVAVGGEAVSPRSRRLRHTLLMVLFLVRVSASATVTASVSRIGVMLDRAFCKYHGMIFSKLNSFQRKLDIVQGQVEGLCQEVRQLACLHSNCHPDRHTRSEPNQEHASSSGSNINFHLRFQNNWKPPIYTDKDITDENNVAIKVAVFDGDKIITTGPFSKAKIEILAIHGSFYKKFQDSWTEEEFDKHIVQGRDEQRVVLGTVWLTNGEAELRQIRFKEGSCRRKFSLAARFCKSKTIAGRVQEAIMEPVEVKDRRNESNEKSNSPRLDDDVYRLDAIAKDGAYHKRLQEANIHTVQDFLKALNKDPDELYKILKMRKKGKSWSKMTEHARKRVLEDKNELRAYQTEDRNVVLFFNCVHDLVGARFDGSYIACEQFNTDHMASVKRLREHAYNRLEVIPYDYVMKGDAPERISSGTSAAAGKSVALVDTVQPISFAEHHEAYQGNGAARNWSHNDINLVTQPTYPCANYGHPNTHDCQGQEIPPTGKQQVAPSFIQPDWQQGMQGLIDYTDLFELESMVDMDLDSGASTYDQLNFEQHQLPQPHQMLAAAAVPPLLTEHEQGPGC